MSVERSESGALRPSAVTYSDPCAEHEDRIKAELAACQQAEKQGNRERAQRHWKRFVELIGERAPEQVRRLEGERGLA